MHGSGSGLKFADSPEGFKISNSNSNNNINNKKEHLRQRRQQRKLPVSPMLLVTNGEVYPEDWVLLDGNAYTTAETAKKDKGKGISGTAQSKDNGASPPTPAPFGVGTPSEAPFITGLIDSSNSNEIGNNDGESNSNGNNAICIAVFSQQPVDAQASTREFSISVDAVYQTDTTSSTEIESHLDDQSLAMALWIAGCEEEANALNTMDKAAGKRRKLQEVAPVLIYYSQIDSWKTTGGLIFFFVQNNHPRPNFFRGTDRRLSPFFVSFRNFKTGSCEEEGSGELMASSSPLCQQKFTSTVQIHSTDDALAEYLTTQITNAFETSVKSFIEFKEGVVAVAIDEIEEEARPESNVDELQTDETQNQSAIAKDNRRTTIIAGSVVAACGIVCILLLVLIGIYEKRRKTSHPNLGYRGRTHVPFVDEFEEDGDSDEDSSVRDLVFVSTHKVIPSDESDTDEEYDASEDIPPPPTGPDTSPCHNASIPINPAPFDEDPSSETVCSAATCQKCESKRQMGVVRRSRSSLIKAIDSSAPVTKVPMHITPNKVTSPRIARRPLVTVTNADASRRNYILEDLVEL
jgi:hypothetical protein